MNRSMQERRATTLHHELRQRDISEEVRKRIRRKLRRVEAALGLNNERAPRFPVSLAATGKAGLVETTIGGPDEQS